MRLCIIPARGGSKRIPLKNIKSFNKKPIIYYSIKAATLSKIFDKIIVSTDHPKIVKIAKSLGVEVPFVRPKKLSNDHIGLTEVVKHAIEWYESKNIFFKEVCCIMATAPLIQYLDLKRSLKKLQKSRFNFCFSATDFSTSVLRSFKISRNLGIKMIFPKYYNYRSQDLEKIYYDAGQFYWGYSDSWKKKKIIFAKYSTPFLLPNSRVQDIDNNEDWKKAEQFYLMKNSFLNHVKNSKLQVRKK